MGVLQDVHGDLILPKTEIGGHSRTAAAAGEGVRCTIGMRSVVIRFVVRTCIASG